MTGRVFPTIGVDPGQRWVGLAARIDGQVLDACTLDRGPDTEGARERYLGPEQAPLADRMLEVIPTMMERHHATALDAARGWDVDVTVVGPWRVAIEGIVLTGAYQNGGMNIGRRIAMLMSLVETAMVFGEVVGQFPGIVVVHPRKLGDPRHDRHGDVLGKLGPYPPQLNGPRPRRFLRGDACNDRRHEKAAWAVAGAAQLARPLLLKQEVLAG